MKQFLDLQKNMKSKHVYEVKAQDKVIAKAGMEKEAQDELRRNEYFERLQKFQDLNDQKTQSLIKYMQADPSSLAEERDRRMYLEGIKQEERKWQQRQNDESRRKKHDIEVLKAGLSNQIHERHNNKIVDQRMEQYYGQKLKEKDDEDFERMRREQEQYRNQQKEYLSSLNTQVKEVGHRKRFEDLMTDQERMLNQKDINAYESMEPVLYSNKIGFHSSPQKPKDISKLNNGTLSVQDKNMGINKKNTAHTGTSDIIAPQIGYDPTNQHRYINNAIKQSEKAERYGLRPAVSNRAYGSDVISRNKSFVQQNNTFEAPYSRNNMSRLEINKSNDSVKRTGEAIINMNANSLSPYSNSRNINYNPDMRKTANRSVNDRVYNLPQQNPQISFPDSRMQVANAYGVNY